MKKVKVCIENLPEFAREFLDNLDGNCIALAGNLGAGKTRFVQEMAKNLDIKERVISPTFVIMKEYKIKSEKRFKKLVHIDAYRLQSEDDLKIFNIKELLNNPENLIFIEWPERLGQDTLKSCKKLSIKNISENCREFTY